LRKNSEGPDGAPDLVRRFIGRNAGIYALYRKDRPCYVGLASGLSGRLKAHSRNRHGKSWGHFSIYLVINNNYLRDMKDYFFRSPNRKATRWEANPLARRACCGSRERKSAEN